MSHPQVAQLSRPEVLNNSDRLLALLLSLREEVNKFVQIAKYICQICRMYLSQLQKRRTSHLQVEKGGLSPSELVSSLVKLIASNNAAVKGEVFLTPKPSFVSVSSVFCKGVPLAHLSCCQWTRSGTIGGEYSHKGEEEVPQSTCYHNQFCWHTSLLCVVSQSLKIFQNSRRQANLWLSLSYFRRI